IQLIQLEEQSQQLRLHIDKTTQEIESVGKDITKISQALRERPTATEELDDKIKLLQKSQWEFESDKREHTKLNQEIEKARGQFNSINQNFLKKNKELLELTDRIHSLAHKCSTLKETITQESLEIIKSDFK